MPVAAVLDPGGQSGRGRREHVRRRRIGLDRVEHRDVLACLGQPRERCIAQAKPAPETTCGP